jgi:hypothetical protein
VAIPFTLLIVALYFLWDRKRSSRYSREDEDLEMDIERLEREIVAKMRQKTMKKVSMWGARNERKAALAADNENDYGASTVRTGITDVRFSDRLAIPQTI